MALGWTTPLNAKGIIKHEPPRIFGYKRPSGATLKLGMTHVIDHG